MESTERTFRETGIWFVYDGECPLCTQAAVALKIKKDFGTLHLVDARQTKDSPLLQQINAMGLDLDEGMVIYDGSQYYHGHSALKFMSIYGEKRGVFNLLTGLFFRSTVISRLLYPWLRGARNWLLKRQGTGRIDNLGLATQPIFQSVFGDDWDKLPNVMKKHYANHPYSNERNTINGKLDLICRYPFKLFSPVLWLVKGIPPSDEQNVSVQVTFESEPSSKHFIFNRVFHFKQKKPYHFRSRMIPVSGSEIIDVMPLRLGWRLNMIWQDNSVKLNHKGYVLHLFGHFIPIPIEFLFGRCNAQEVAIDDETFNMDMHITHPWWGRVYGYTGKFKLM